MNSILLFLGRIGMQEILLVGLFVFIFFGAKKIPDLMKGIGKGVREFQDGVKGIKEDIDKSMQSSPVEVKAAPSTETVK